MTRKRALVTGCAGFIGSHLSERLLDDGYDVVGIDCFTDYYPRQIKEKNLERAFENEYFTLIEEDISKMTSFPDVDLVFHQAAQAGVRASWGESFHIYTQYNILGTQRLLEHYKDQGLEKFVYASSSSIYGDARSIPVTEDALPRPISPYGVSKLAGEHLSYLYYKNFGVPTISLRYFTVYGPRQRPDMAINKFTHAIKDGRSFTVYGDGTQTRDFTFVDDVVEANILAARARVNGEAFNIGGGSRITVNDLIQEIENQLGKKAVKEHIDPQKGDVRDTWADVGYAEKHLGWTPKVDIREGVKRYVEWVLDTDGS